MIKFRDRWAACAWLVAVAACSRSHNSPNGAIPNAGVAVTDTGVSEPSLLGDASVGTAAATIQMAYFTALPVSGKSIGHTSVVFKLGLCDLREHVPCDSQGLDGGLNAAYKPRSHRGGQRYRGEIAAYRLARAWGLDNVPPAIPRSFPADALKKSLDEKASALFADEGVIEADGTVRGALIPWISHLAFMPLETDEWRAKWSAWLEGDPSALPAPTAASPIGGCQRDLAGQISTMIAFDVMTGNWDRWSGGNVGDVGGPGQPSPPLPSGCTRLLYIDNDGAFFDPVPAKPLADQIALLHKIQLFSRGFVTKLRSVAEPDLERSLGDEIPGTPLLSRRVIDAFFARRKIVLAAIDEKIAARGEEATLAFE